MLLICFPLESLERGSSSPVVFLSDIPDDVVTAAPLLRRRYSLAANRAWHCQQCSSHYTRKLREFWSCRKNDAEHGRFGDDQAECSLPTTQEYTATSRVNKRSACRMGWPCLKQNYLWKVAGKKQSCWIGGATGGWKDGLGVRKGHVQSSASAGGPCMHTRSALHAR